MFSSHGHCDNTEDCGAEGILGSTLQGGSVVIVWGWATNTAWDDIRGLTWLAGNPCCHWSQVPTRWVHFLFLQSLKGSKLNLGLLKQGIQMELSTLAQFLNNEARNPVSSTIFSVISPQTSTLQAGGVGMYLSGKEPVYYARDSEFNFKHCLIQNSKMRQALQIGHIQEQRRV